MELILVRHGPAEDRDAFARTGRPDRDRPLTTGGRRQTRGAAAGLATLLTDPPRVYTSPFVRASETAEIIATACGVTVTRSLAALAPGGRRDRVLRSVGESGTAILVGHEPDMGQLLSWLLAGHPEPFHRFKKAGMVAVSCPEGPGQGGAELRWALPPGVLRALAP